MPVSIFASYQADTIREEHMLQIESSQSQYFSIAIDETTDITTIKQMIVYIKYLDTSASPYKVNTKFLGIVPVR